MFAFGSYVIGQISMWAGDDATAKKWFYEALRLDPASEAGQQVRILARRVAPAPPSAEGTSGGDAPREPAPVQMSAAAPAAAESPGRGAPSGRWARRLVPGAALLATVLVVLAVAKKSGPRAGFAPSAPAVDSQPKETSAPSDWPPRPPIAGEPAPAKKTAAAVHDSDADGAKTTRASDPEGANDDEKKDPRKGTVLLPARASGHRIFVDGRSAKTDGIAPLHLRCGPHVIQIGSSGTPEDVNLPCGGEVQLQ